MTMFTAVLIKGNVWKSLAAKFSTEVHQLVNNLNNPLSPVTQWKWNTAAVRVCGVPVLSSLVQ